MGRGMKAADLMAERDEDFLRGVVLVGKGDEDALSVSRRDRGQREHMALDDVLLDLRDLKVAGYEHLLFELRFYDRKRDRF